MHSNTILLLLISIPLIVVIEGNIIPHRGNNDLSSLTKNSQLSNKESRVARTYISCTSATCGKYSDFLRKIPRFTYDGSRLTNDWAPESKNYERSLDVIGTPFIFIGIGVFLGGVVMLVVTFSDCCTKDYKHLPPTEKRETKKNRRTIPALKFTVILLGVFMSVAILMGVLYSFSLDSYVRNAVKAIMKTEDRIINQDVNVLIELLKELKQYDDVISPETEELIVQMNQAYNMSRTKEAMIKRDESLRVIMTTMGFVSIWIFEILAIVGFWRFSFRGTFPFLVLSVAILVASAQWMIVGVHIPLSVFLADMCPTIEEKLTTSPNQQWIEYYLSCKGESPFASVHERIQKKEQDLEAFLQWAIENGFPESTIEELTEIVDELKSLEARVDDLADCSKTKEAWQIAYQSLCNKAFTALEFVTLTAVINAVFMLVSLFIYEFILVRVRRSEKEDYYDMHNIDIQEKKPLMFEDDQDEEEGQFVAA